MIIVKQQIVKYSLCHPSFIVIEQTILVAKKCKVMRNFIIIYCFVNICRIAIKSEEKTEIERHSTAMNKRDKLKNDEKYTSDFIKKCVLRFSWYGFLSHRVVIVIEVRKHALLRTIKVHKWLKPFHGKASIAKVLINGNKTVVQF